jgi:hypothetical protein
VSLLNLSHEPKRVRLVTKTPVRCVVDMVNSKQTAFPLTVSPLDPVLLALDLAAS